MKYCRLIYFAMLAWWILWASLFYFVLGDIIAKNHKDNMDWWAVIGDSYVDSDSGREIGAQFVYRISFMLLIFHLIIGLLSIGAESSSPGVFMAIHRKGMPWKFLAQLVLWFAFTCIPNVAFIYINYIVGIFAGVYVIAQFVVLMETSYRLNEHLLGGGEKSGPAIAYTVIVYLVTLTLLVLGFYYPLSLEASHPMFISLAEVLGIMITATVIIIVCLVVTLLIPTATIIASSTISLALASHACLIVCQIIGEKSGFNPIIGDVKGYITGIQSFEIVLLAATAFFGAISMISISVLFGAAKTKYSEYEGYDSGEDEEKKAPSYAYYGFHVVCMALVCYLTVIFSSDPEMPYCLGIGTILGSLLYIWTLVAPKLLPDRDFGV